MYALSLAPIDVQMVAFLIYLTYFLLYTRLACLPPQVEDYDNYCGQLFTQCCACIYTQKVLVGSGPRESLRHKYSMRTGLCCWGRVDNCCGATCCKPNLIIDIVDPSDKLVSTVQKTYGKGQGCEGCLRSVSDFDNYILEFPPDASEAERAMLMTAVFSMDYALFSKKGGDND